MIMRGDMTSVVDLMIEELASIHTPGHTYSTTILTMIWCCQQLNQRNENNNLQVLSNEVSTTAHHEEITLLYNNSCNDMLRITKIMVFKAVQKSTTTYAHPGCVHRGALVDVRQKTY